MAEWHWKKGREPPQDQAAAIYMAASRLRFALCPTVDGCHLASCQTFGCLGSKLAASSATQQSLSLVTERRLSLNSIFFPGDAARDQAGRLRRRNTTFSICICAKRDGIIRPESFLCTCRTGNKTCAERRREPRCVRQRTLSHSGKAPSQICAWQPEAGRGWTV